MAAATVSTPGAAAKATQVDPQVTLLSSAMPVAQPQPSSAMPVAQPHTTSVGGPPTNVEPIRTLPHGSSWTQDVTSARNRVAPASPIAAESSQLPAQPPTPSQQIRAVSASDDAAPALAAMKAAKNVDYDKLVGETLDGRYFVQKKIGEGGMGVVFSARHAVIERPLAIKVLKREVMRDTATIKRFVQEAKAASRIGHPNIVDVTDFGTTPDGLTYSVMEYVAGSTLGSTLREAAPFPQLRAIKIAVQIARALGAAHDKGIVHRDLKPENVFLVDRDGRPDFVKIVDFGIAKVAPIAGSNNPNEPRLTRAGSVFGTPEYMAPEQAAGKSDTDGRVDIYALGVILYEMLTGKVPHRGDSTVRTLAMVMLDPVDPPSKVRTDIQYTPELETVVLRALAKKRESRYQTMGELIKDLESVQPIVGKSITGSPVYALSPVPPGASVAALQRPVTDDAAAHARPALSLEEASARVPESARIIPVSGVHGPITKRAHEPEFVSGDKPPTFELAFEPSGAELPRRRWTLALFSLIGVGAAAAIAIMVFSRGCAVAPPAPDAAVIVMQADAAPPPPVQVDAAVPLPMDAPDIIVVETPDAGRVYVRPRDAGVVAIAPDAGGGFARGWQIQVITKPEGANLYDVSGGGNSYTGPGGVHIEKPIGTKMDLECRLSGYKAGKLRLEFDGKTEYALCVLTRIKICVDGLKNPFDDCEVAPARP